MTKVLIVTQEIDPTADRLVADFRRQGIPFERVHPADIPSNGTLSIDLAPGRAPEGTLQAPGVNLSWEDVTSVWYRRPEQPNLPDHLTEEEADFALMETREALFGVWRLLDVFWVNHPDRIRRAGSKPLQLVFAAELGFAIPRTLFTNDPRNLKEFVESVEGPVVYKAMTQGYLGVQKQQCIYTSRLRRDHLNHADLLRLAPGIFQEEVPKQCDLRVTVIGRQIFAVEIHSQEDPEGRLDWRRAAVPRMKHVAHNLPEAIQQACLGLMDRFALNYAAIDLILTKDGQYVFLELNPSGQFAWIEDFTGLPLFAALGDLLASPGTEWVQHPPRDFENCEPAKAVG